MRHLGAPTTRALSLASTDETAARDMLYDGNPRGEPGVVMCRMAPPFIRFGIFEVLFSRYDHELLAKLAYFTIDRDFPEIEGTTEEKRIPWFGTVCEGTAVMPAHCVPVGFVHAVMNTDRPGSGRAASR
jgi:uncharacterized protein YdiU (UPF0061 family)